MCRKLLHSISFLADRDTCRACECTFVPPQFAKVPAVNVIVYISSLSAPVDISLSSWAQSWAGRTKTSCEKRSMIGRCSAAVSTFKTSQREYHNLNSPRSCLDSQSACARCAQVNETAAVCDITGGTGECEVGDIASVVAGRATQLDAIYCSPPLDSNSLPQPGSIDVILAQRQGSSSANHGTGKYDLLNVSTTVLSHRLHVYFYA